jgi:hypothetical protein
MIFLVLSTACTGLFCGAALYVNLVEHPARMSCGQELAVREFTPSYRRATIMQASLAVGGLAFGLIAAWQLHNARVAFGAAAIGSVVPYTLIVMLPTNHQLEDSALDPRGAKAAGLLRRWNQMHWVRTILSGIGFALLLCSLASH